MSGPHSWDMERRIRDLEIRVHKLESPPQETKIHTLNGAPVVRSFVSEQYVTAVRLGILARNLATAGAIEHAYALGWDRGNGVDICDTAGTWLPNVDGRSAP